MLTKESLLDVVSNNVPDRPSSEWRASDGKTRFTIGLLLEDNQLHLIRRLTTARETWSALWRYHEKSILSYTVSLLRKLCGLKLNETGNIENHIAQVEDVIDELASLSETLAEHLTVALFLSSPPNSYGTLITALKTRPEGDLT